jgi:hypothetical protein
MRAIRTLLDEALPGRSRDFDRFYARDNRPARLLKALCAHSLDGNIAVKFLASVLKLPNAHNLLSSKHFGCLPEIQHLGCGLWNGSSS